ncbi:MAG: nucleotidyl cyclase domain-containing protein [Planctomycetota bacterium]
MTDQQGIDSQRQSRAPQAMAARKGIDFGERSVPPPLLSDWLLQERRRAERYNSFFSLMVLASPRLSAEEILGRIAGAMRASDVLGVVDAEGRYHCLGGSRRLPAQSRDASAGEAVVGVILPHTDRKGLQCAVGRLSVLLPSHDQVSIGMSVCPDDSNRPEELVAIATKGCAYAGRGFRKGTKRAKRGP